MNNAIINFYGQNKLKISGFSPADISSMSYWHDYTDTSTLDLDTSGTTSVYRVKNLLNNNYEFLNPTKSLQPLTGNDGKNYIIPGTSTNANGLWGTVSWSGFYTSIIIYKYDSGTTGDFWPEISDANGDILPPFGSQAGRYIQFRLRSNKDIFWLSRNPWFQANIINETTLQDSNTHILVIRNNDTNKQIWYDGVKILDETKGSTDSLNDQQLLGLCCLSSGNIKYRTYEQIRYTKALTTTELSEIYSYYQSKYS